MITNSRNDVKGKNMISWTKYLLRTYGSVTALSMGSGGLE